MALTKYWFHYKSEIETRNRSKAYVDSKIILIQRSYWLKDHVNLKIMLIQKSYWLKITLICFFHFLPYFLDSSYPVSQLTVSDLFCSILLANYYSALLVKLYSLSSAKLLSSDCSQTLRQFCIEELRISQKYENKSH